MRLLMLAVLAIAPICQAADEPAKPAPQEMSGEDRSAVLSNMLTVSLLEAQLNNSPLMQALKNARAENDRVLAEMRTKYHAEGCGVSVKGVWTGCPEPKTEEEVPAAGEKKDE